MSLLDLLLALIVGQLPSWPGSSPASPASASASAPPWPAWCSDSGFTACPPGGSTNTSTPPRVSQRSGFPGGVLGHPDGRRAGRQSRRHHLQVDRALPGWTVCWAALSAWSAEPSSASAFVAVLLAFSPQAASQLDGQLQTAALRRRRIQSVRLPGAGGFEGGPPRRPGGASQGMGRRTAQIHGAKKKPGDGDPKRLGNKEVI